jgi:hypothetical protein
MFNFNGRELAQLMSSGGGKFDRMLISIFFFFFSFAALSAVLGVIFSSGAIDSFAQSELATSTTTGSTQDQERNATAFTQSLGNPFFVEQGRIIGQRVLAVTPQPQLEFSFMANATISSGGDNIVINAINTGTSVSTLNADGTFSGQGQGILRTEGGDVATWTNQVVGNLTPEGTIITRGVGFWSTPSTTGELAFMDRMITIFEVQIDREGNLSAREWEWG